MSRPAHALACLVVLTAGNAFAQDAARLYDRSLAATCAQCHGTDGRAAPGAALPGLAGLPAATLAAQMTAFKSGTRAGTVMPQLAKGFSDAQIDRLAAWFAQAGAATDRTGAAPKP
jgi:cytochrome subunit of sulfide dehydrogenase